MATNEVHFSDRSFNMEKFLCGVAVAQPEWGRRGHAPPPPKQTCHDFYWCFLSIFNCYKDVSDWQHHWLAPSEINYWLRYCRVIRVKRFTNVNFYCIVINLRKISKMLSLPSPAKCLRTPMVATIVFSLSFANFVNATTSNSLSCKII